MTRPESPTRRADLMWSLLALVVGTIALAFVLWWLVEPTVQRLIEDAGRLNACAGHVAECSAIAESL